ncbi:Spx/MgsR family RNA polymerase-binding regulatory protein [Alicyclobacillus curvatus]|nr:Spx/MgsR family RNA polymerase-binding regulatory protein [Alicyclobacillus curvatus]
MEFYGYKKCSTCRNAHKHLQDGGIAVEFQDFVVTPPSAGTIKSWVDSYGQGIMPFVNTKGTRYRELNLANQNLTEAEWLEMLSNDGKLLKRPVLVTDEGVVVGYDKTQYDRLVGRG